MSEVPSSNLSIHHLIPIYVGPSEKREGREKNRGHKTKGKKKDRKNETKGLCDRNTGARDFFSISSAHNSLPLPYKFLLILQSSGKRDFLREDFTIYLN